MKRLTARPFPWYLLLFLMLFTLVETARPASSQEANLVPNPGLEVIGSSGLPEGWKWSRIGDNDAQPTYPVPGNPGHAAQVTINRFVSGDSKWYFDHVPVTPYTRYHFSDTFSSTGTSQLDIEYRTQSGSLKHQFLKDLPPVSEWTKVDVSFVTPGDAAEMTMLHLLTSTGSLAVDNYVLDKPPVFDQGMVSLVFDDGYRRAYEAVSSILEPAGLKSTHAVITHTGAGGYPDYTTLVEWRHLRELGDEVVSHTRSHPHLPLLDLSTLQNEIVGSRQDLMAEGIVPVRGFVVPYGEYDDRVIQTARDAGYQWLRTTQRDYNDKAADRFRLGIQEVETSTSLETIQGWIDTAIASRTWLILTFHDIRDDGGGDKWTTTPAVLQGVADYLKAQNAKVVTVSQGVQEMADLPPVNVSLAPRKSASASGRRHTLKATYSDPDGWGDIRYCAVRIGSANRRALYAQYSAESNKLFLLDDAGHTYLGGVVPGTPGVIRNRQGVLDCAATRVSGSGNTLTIEWSFLPASRLAGTRSVFLHVRDWQSKADDLERKGLWKIKRR